MLFLYNVLYIYSVPIGYTSYTKPWDKPITIEKLGAEFPELHYLLSATSEMVVMLFDFPTVGKVPQTLHCSPQNLASFSEVVDMGPNKPLTLTCGSSPSHLWDYVPSHFLGSPWSCWWTSRSWPMGLMGSQLLHTISFWWRFACHLSGRGHSAGWIPFSFCIPQGFGCPPTTFQPKSDVVGQGGCGPCPGSLPSHCQ